MRFALIVEYDGAEFNGSQFQLNARTVQGELERAATTIFGTRISRVRMASRTDAGVHAFAQVAAVDAESEMPADEMRRAFNGNLPEDVAVKSVRQVSFDFDPRRSATARGYRYLMNDSLTRSPLNRRYEYATRRRLDTGAMSAAAEMFVGTHDFESFGAASTDNGSTIRRIESARIYRIGDGRIVFDVRANAFLRQQIRRMAAALIAVGDGSKSSEWLKSLIESPRPNGATPERAAARIDFDACRVRPEFRIVRNRRRIVRAVRRHLSCEKR